MSGPETGVERCLDLVVRRAGGLTVKLAPTTTGTPDRLVLLPGVPARLVEIKAPHGRLRAVQTARHARLAASGHPVTVLSCAEEVLDWVTAQVLAANAADPANVLRP